MEETTHGALPRTRPVRHSRNENDADSGRGVPADSRGIFARAGHRLGKGDDPSVPAGTSQTASGADSRGPVIMLPGDSARVSIDAFGVLGGPRPTLIKTGFGPLDRAIGGLFPGTCGILGADTGVGKSSLVLAASMATSTTVGVISTEDAPDVWGTRMLAAVSGVNSLDMRKGTLSDEDRKAIQAAQKALGERSSPMVAYAIGGSLEAVLEATRRLADAGCTLVWLDYVQKVRGVKDDRRNEVGTVYTKFQGLCAELGVVGMVVSQLSRRIEDTKNPRPKTYHLKESGDLENEARLVLLAWEQDGLLKVCLAKSTVGMEGLTWSYTRDGSGTLREVERHLVEEDL